MFERMRPFILTIVIISGAALMYFVGNLFFIIAMKNYLMAAPILLFYIGVVIFCCSVCDIAWRRAKGKWPLLKTISG